MGARDADHEIDPEQMFEAIVERLETLSEHKILSSTGMVAPELANPAIGHGEALVVDDDDNERELLAGFLRMCDYRVRTAVDGLDAITKLRGNQVPNVILLDMQMPRCDGKSFLQQIRSLADLDPVHVFVISASTPAELGLSERDGYTHWFHKPLDPRRIVERLSTIESPSASVA